MRPGVSVLLLSLLLAQAHGAVVVRSDADKPSSGVGTVSTRSYGSYGSTESSFFSEDWPESCKSDIYCSGDLLRVVQLTGLYPDSKTFVDMKLRVQPEVAKKSFADLMTQTGNKPSREHVQNFVNSNFEEGDELEVWTPSDWKEEPSLLPRLSRLEYRTWASELNGLWKTLGRKMKTDVRDNPQLYSLIYVPNGFVVPGGRFRELYYWDTYWIVKGMLLCDMHDTVKGVIENLMWLVKTLGFIPNGSRVYYEERSQPPLLIGMARAYYDHTKDLDFITKNMKTLETEFKYWLNNTLVEVEKDGKKYTMARYFFPSKGPRPESYREDYETAAGLSEEKKQEMYCELKSGAGSGWDFSSRWFIDKSGRNNGNLTNIKVSRIIPVDLNAFLYGAAKDLEHLHKELGNLAAAKSYSKWAAEMEESIQAVFWHEEDGIWYDWDTLNNKPRRYFFGSNFAPLWTQSYDQKDSMRIGAKVAAYVEKNGAMHYLGGTPTSMYRTGEQWDFPNCWAPLQALLIQGLDRTGEPAAQKMAAELADRWVFANFKGWADHSKMYEKYDAESIGTVGGGGEYDAQTGFGWSNGLIFELLDQYFTNPEITTRTPGPTPNMSSTSLPDNAVPNSINNAIEADRSRSDKNGFDSRH